MNDKQQPKFNRKPLYGAVIGGLIAMGGGTGVHSASSNPCAVRGGATATSSGELLLLAASCTSCNPCAACNPCNPCADACNPCAVEEEEEENLCNPCAACNPCSPCAAACNPCADACNPCNPCGGGAIQASDFKRPGGELVQPEMRDDLIAYGEKLWNDASLSSNGLACQTCHMSFGALNPTFAEPYPHWVAMPAQMAGVQEVSAEEMVQFCMLVPMQSETFDWSSKELAALASYTVALQAGFNPCGGSGEPLQPVRSSVQPLQPLCGGVQSLQPVRGRLQPLCSGESLQPLRGVHPCAVEDEEEENPCNPCAAACNPCNPCADACNPCNPCAGACNPCAAANPCNPCAACNPCAVEEEENPCNPCAAACNPCNPCASENPCESG